MKSMLCRQDCEVGASDSDQNGRPIPSWQRQQDHSRRESGKSGVGMTTSEVMDWMVLVFDSRQRSSMPRKVTDGGGDHHRVELPSYHAT